MPKSRPRPKTRGTDPTRPRKRIAKTTVRAAPVIGGQDGNSIAWLVDVLGSEDLLKAVKNSKADPDNPVHIAPHRRDEGYRAFADTLAAKEDGLYFKSGHWTAIRDRKTLNSYDLGYQLKGTAHFCQTFALMMYLERPGLKRSAPTVNNYSYNVKQAAKFWRDTLNEEKALMNKFITIAKHDLDGDDYDDGQFKVRNGLKKISRITSADVTAVFNEVAASSDDIYHSKET